MNRDELFSAFRQLPADEQELIREQILMSGYETPEAGSAMATCLEIMREIKDGKDPMRVCRDMVEDMAGICCPD